MPILKVNTTNIDACVARLARGELVAFPTETVYGLAGDARNSPALAAIFEQKNRPQFNPLICHLRDFDAARKQGVFNATALRLAQRFWSQGTDSGALTLVVPRRDDCDLSPLLSAGLANIALRVPQNEVAQALLAACGFPLAAPSANISGRLSPTRAEHVAEMFPELSILDGGACAYGLESTIIGCLPAGTFLLRSGALAIEDIEAVLNAPLTPLEHEGDDAPQLAPGRLARHYAPRARLRLNVVSPRPDEALLGFGAMPSHAGDALNLSESGDLAEAAGNLFAHLHALDKIASAIAVMPIPKSGLGVAINDRLIRAAAQS